MEKWLQGWLQIVFLAKINQVIGWYVGSLKGENMIPQFGHFLSMKSYALSLYKIVPIFKDSRRNPFTIKKTFLIITQ